LRPVAGNPGSVVLDGVVTRIGAKGPRGLPSFGPPMMLILNSTMCCFAECFFRLTPSTLFFHKGNTAKVPVDKKSAVKGKAPVLKLKQVGRQRLVGFIAVSQSFAGVCRWICRRCACAT
jgi:hypothetical protein